MPQFSEASIDSKFTPFAKRMQNEGLPDIVTGTFEYYYKQLLKGKTGLIPEADIKRVNSLPDAETFSSDLTKIGETALSKTILLKLNGGLGTSMGLDRAKSLLTVKNNLTFLDIIARQAHQANIPLVLMNSFATQTDSLAALKNYPDLFPQIPRDFVQHKIPKIDQTNLSPVTWPQDPDLEWCPPGHGDIYTALVTGGMLDILLEHGYETAFVSNSDNLGAVIDTAILGYFVKNHLPFMMEAADRTEADKKGGHLAILRNTGQLILRESAQCPRDDMDDFQDISRHKYFNTNNLWLNLPALKSVLQAKNNILGLPMIRNGKTVDPRDSNSTPVYQLETAMGSAIAVFEGAGAVRVPRTRFAPVKTTNDLLTIRSDAYILTDDFHIIQNPTRKAGPIVVSLDAYYYKLVDQMEARFPHGTPSLIECNSLHVEGDIKFGQNVTLKGSVQLTNDSDRQGHIENVAIIQHA